MKSLTNHEKHILLWDELFKTGVSINAKDEVFKRLFPDCDGNSEAACNSCWACQEDTERMSDDDEFACLHCPIDWLDDDGKSVKCNDDCTLFYKWYFAADPEARKLLAAQIRDLPWREL
jgi:hypothetical protein